MAKLSKYKKVSTEADVEVKVSDDYPKKIRFSSDGSELDFVEAKKIDGKIMVYYRYTKSLAKLNQLLPILDIHLKGALSSQFCNSIK